MRTQLAKYPRPRTLSHVSGPAVGGGAEETSPRHYGGKCRDKPPPALRLHGAHLVGAMWGFRVPSAWDVLLALRSRLSAG